MNRKQFFTLATLATAVHGTAHADLFDYLRRPDPSFRWEKRGEKRVDGVIVVDLHLVSQTWQGIVWEHRLQWFVPEQPTYPDFCLLLNTGGGGNVSEEKLGIDAARSTGHAFAILYHIPNQPLYDGLVEDALIVRTWQKFVETGDETWPLHFPMAKAVLRAMDTLQASAKTDTRPQPNRFAIMGASKRGWTTWLVGASGDRRVVGIVPMVIDTLNLTAQLPHQLEAYQGTLSEQIDDYTRGGFAKPLTTDREKRLVQIVDPYTQRHRLRLPKLLILGTNDRYWAQDALNLYWDGLEGQKSVLYVPNSGHGLEDRPRVYATLFAFSRSVAGRKPWPKLRWRFEPARLPQSPLAQTLHVSSDVPMDAVRLFTTTSATKDFRDSEWSFIEQRGTTRHAALNIAPPATGNAVTFAEAVYTIDGQSFTLSTQLRILPASPK
jgi:PhoPQ-activated pathogenicity-related protein